jgi:uncharacterized membrane protein
MSAVFRGFLLYASALQVVVAAFGTAQHPPAAAPFFGVAVLGLACFAVVWLHTPKARTERWS